MIEQKSDNNYSKSGIGAAGGGCVCKRSAMIPSLLRRSASGMISSTWRALSNAFAFNDVQTSRIKNATFQIENGAKVCVAGTNEKAKMDILNLINGTKQPTSGTVERPMSNYFLFSPIIHKEFYPLSVEDYVARESSPDSGKSVPEALDDAGIKQSLRSLPVSDLSASQRARLQMAAALMHNPDVLLLDNPTMTKQGPYPDSEITKIIEFILKFPKTCVVNSSDKDFLNSFSDNVLSVADNGNVELFVGSLTSAQNLLEERSTEGEEKITNSDVRFALFLLFLLCPFEAFIFFYYQ